MGKPSLSIADQHAKITLLGLADTPPALHRALASVGYFRLSGYWRYFQVQPSQGVNRFEPGANIASIMDCYHSDAALRNLLMEGLAEVEVAARAVLVAKLCKAGGSGDEYLDPKTYDAAYDAKGNSLTNALLRDIHSDIDRSKERHVRHHRDKGTAVPLWVATEALSFGVLSRMYGLLADQAQRDFIAKRFGYTSSNDFSTNLRAVSVFRNVCAHHGRIWNRTIAQDVPKILPFLVEKSLIRMNYDKTPWGVISVVVDFVNRVRGHNGFSAEVSTLVPRSGIYWDGLISPSTK
ncbi:Abi family protein [Microbacterium murale]|uniref:DNA-binding protein n=1 Tax=Microbacterium murale TaxID=1081040 RepID=A0ABQ1RWV5_9MICO|nr:Abi family protein [Microbacterium murale]GGD83253.1 DNA-binding protein [Microbacterium murale]